MVQRPVRGNPAVSNDSLSGHAENVDRKDHEIAEAIIEEAADQRESDMKIYVRVDRAQIRHVMFKMAAEQRAAGDVV